MAADDECLRKMHFAVSGARHHYKIRVMDGTRVDTDTKYIKPYTKVSPFKKKGNATRIVYADLIGQSVPSSGSVINQLLEHPPAGYRFVTRKKITTTIADSLHSNAQLRKMKRSMQRFIPTNLLVSCVLTRFMKPPVAVDLTYSMSTVIFRPEPWVLYLEVPTQLAGYNHHSLQRFRSILESGLGSPYCRAIICQSEAARCSLMRRLNTGSFEHKLHVIRCGWFPKPVMKPRFRSDERVRILFVGASTMAFGFPIKGGLESLEAFAALRQLYPHVELTMRCDVETKVRRRFEGLPGFRIIDKLIPKHELETLYEQADIYWYPAHCLMSISVLEAMSYGLPVVTTDYYDNSEYVEDGRTGMIVPQRQHVPGWDTSELEVRRALEAPAPVFVKALVEKTRVLIENSELRRRMGRAARSDVETKFSLSEKNLKFKNIFDEAIGFW